MIVDGKQIADEIYAALAGARSRKRRPRLGILVAHDPGPVIESFVRIKTRAAERLGVEIVRIEIPKGAATASAVAALATLSAKVDGVIVQLPLPVQIDIDTLLSAIPRDRDVDGLNPTIAEDDRIVHAPVAGAVEIILKRYAVDTIGARAVVVGSGRLVGAPVAALLRRLGADVSVVTLDEGSLDELKDADIVVLGAGDPGFVTPDMLKDGVVLIDAGTSEAGGKVMGDADSACQEVAEVFTPVPGGVGPIAVAMIFKNLFTLVQNKTPSDQ